MRAVPVYVMRVSGLRLRLAGGFAAAFAIGLALLAAFGIAYLKRESTRRFDVRLDSVVGEVIAELRREETEYPDSSLTFVASRVATEWSDTNDAFVIFDVAGTAIGAYDPHHLSQRIREALAASPDAVRLSLIQTDPHLRVRIVDAAPFQRALQSGARVHIVTFGSSEGIEQDSQLLGVLFAVSAPLIVLISLAAGYVLAGRALKPVRDLANAMSAIAPTDLNHRLAAGTDRSDEVSAVAIEFNALLGRLEEAQRRNGNFVREAAHQIRTPLTLVLGEAGHALRTDHDRATDDPAAMFAALGRIRTAAEVMRRRVDELFRLAEVRTGEAVRLEQQVELDGLVLECTDLMRARATESGHKLAIGAADAAVVTGHSALLQEAVLELLENACRYADTTTAITVSCAVHRAQDGARAVLDVSSAGAPFALPPATIPEHARHGMGLSIVRWVAESHHAEFDVRNDNGINRVSLSFPLAS